MRLPWFNCEVDGGSGDDTMIGGKSGDVLVGGPGQDTIYGGPGFDSCEGGNGNDFIDGGQSDDGIDGGTGRDILVGGGGSDAINGGAAEDIVIGGFLSNSSVASLKAVWFDPLSNFETRLLTISLSPPIVVQDPLEDLVAGGIGRDLFLTNIVPPVNPVDPAEDLSIDFIDNVDADYSDFILPTFLGEFDFSDFEIE